MADVTQYAAGTTTLGVELAYGTYTDNSTLPESVTALGRINAIAGIDLDQEDIDVSALTDYVTQYEPGRMDTGGDWTITVNVTDATLAEWQALRGQKKFFEVVHPKLTNAIWVVATVPKMLGFSDIGQNENWTTEVHMTLNYMYGIGTKVVPANTVNTGA